jgi:peptide/nickel transport system substrate-binding protein
MTAGLTRGDFLRRASAMGAFVGAGGATAVLAACGDDDESQGAGTGGPTGPQDAIYSDYYGDLPRGGDLRVGHSEQVPDSLDLPVAALGATFWSAGPAHDFLEQYDPTGKIRPSLAEKVQVVSPTEIRYRLRPRVRFHNGRRVVAADVKKTIDFVNDPDNASFFADRTVGVTARVVNDREVRILLDQPNADQRALLTAIPIVPVEEAKKQARTPVGCGPFVFEEWVRDSHIDYRKFDGYWNPAAPRLDRLRINHYADSSAGGQALLSNELDAVLPVDIAQAPEFKSREESGALTTITIEDGVVHLGINLDREPFNDARVRRAIRLCVDREAMAAAPFNGLSTPRWFLGIKPDNPYYPKGLEYERDVDEAKRLMAEAGHSGGVKTQLLAPNFGYFQSCATIAKSNLAEIGIDAELEIVDLATSAARLLEDKDYYLSVFGFTMDPTPSARIDRYVTTGGPANYFNYSSKEADRLLTQAKSIVAVGERRELYRAAFQKIFLDDVPVVPVAGEVSVGAATPEVNIDQFGPLPASRWHYQIAAVGT